MGIVFMSLTLTVFYDIPQLNLGLHLHKHADIHFREEDTTAAASNSEDVIRDQYCKNFLPLLTSL